MELNKGVRVAALMTAPRYEAVYARNFIELAMKALGIPLTISGGVYYGQCMQIMLEDLVSKDVDYVLTIDFDSMFTAEHVQRLLNLIASDDNIDAITAVQPKRGCGAILAAMDKETTMVWNGRPVKVTSAHFGLTVIDLKKLAELPKPWFHAQPDKDGRWTDDKIDDDVWFWKQWREAGNSIYVDPGCRLGHLEEMVTVYSPTMELQHLYPREWSETRESTVDS